MGLEGFFKLLAENREHQEHVQRLGGDIDALVDYASKLGYDVSMEELQKYKDKAQELLKAKVRKKLAKPDVALSPGAEAFYALIKLAETDEEVDKRMTELAAANPEELIAYGKEKGFVFDAQDMQAIAASILEPTDELSDEELEMAAGGIVDLIALAVFVGIGLGVAAAGGVGVAAGVGAVAGFVLGFTALAKK
ncbi:MAG: Nif11-like leader peptide family RiPP precursor [Defluviitaleaceae bacterium]|nr:Nif11-like leader peptide family RiPP precursor [Defluviitaleaceae bacterium]